MKKSEEEKMSIWVKGWSSNCYLIIEWGRDIISINLKKKIRVCISLNSKLEITMQTYFNKVKRFIFLSLINHYIFINSFSIQCLIRSHCFYLYCNLHPIILYYNSCLADTKLCLESGNLERWSNFLLVCSSQAHQSLLLSYFFQSCK